MTPSAVTVDEIRTLAKLAGLEVAPDALPLLAERISGVRAQLAAIPDAALAKVEPAFVLPLATRSGA
jgi:hypothetical protein